MNTEQRVLIIGSDFKNCKAIKYALTESGIGTYYTLSVIDGIECLNRHNYELVILDISLSEMNGFQLLWRYNAAAPPLPDQRCYTIVTFENLSIDPLTRRVVYNRQKLDGQRQTQAKLVADLTANSVSSYQVESISGYLWDWESVDFDDKRRVLDTLVSQVSKS